MERVLAGLLVLVGIIHLLPLPGVLGADRLAALYGISFDEHNLEILMRHRAILLGLIGGLSIFAAFCPPFRFLAIVTGFVSVVSFLVLVWSVGVYNAAIQKVVVADLVALIALVFAAVIYGYTTTKTSFP